MHRALAVLAAAASLAALAAATAAAAAPVPVVVRAAPFPAAVRAFERPSPPRLEVVSDLGHPVRVDTTARERARWIPEQVGGAALLRLIPQGNLGFAVYGADYASERFLVGLDLRRQRVRYAFDLDGLAHVPAATPAERPYVEPGIVWAREAGGVLYVSHAHSTYAASSRGLNAAISAIEVTTGRLLWRSPSLVANAGTFVLAPGNLIVSGYGFTKEADYVYVLDRRTGRVLDRLPVRDGPELITRKGTEIRVETYSRSLVLRLRG